MSRTDLTGYAALLGESLSSRVELLGHLLGSAHYLSLGQYKERLLAETIRDFLPRTVEVGTGFVIFPHADVNPPGPDFFDPLNQSAYSISRQCDIIVFDSTRFPVIFRDGDFVIVRPEAVKAVIEVKGSLSKPETIDALESFHDFGLKWRTTQLFYAEKNVPTTPTPALYLMAWKLATNKAGRPLTTPAAIRDTIAKFYAEKITQSDLDGYPILEQLLIHNEAQITSVFQLEEVEAGEYTDHFGWSAVDGRFIRVAKDGTLFRDKDRTIAALLAALHWDIAQPDFNRFFSYQDEVKNQNIIKYKYAGISRTWSNLNTEDARRITNRIVTPHPELPINVNDRPKFARR